jgi:hypothetical protein
VAPRLVWGWSATSFFAKGVAGATPTAGLGVVEPPPWPRGWSGHPQKPKKKKKRKMGSGLLGVAGPPPRTWGWIRPPQKAGLGWTNPPPGPWGWSGHPQKAKTHFSFFFFLGFWGWPDHPLGHGVVRPPPDRPWGWLEPPLISFPPPPPLFFLIFSFFFFLFFFFLKKIMIKWPKRRRFEAQNSVVLELKMT